MRVLNPRLEGPGLPTPSSLTEAGRAAGPGLWLSQLAHRRRGNQRLRTGVRALSCVVFRGSARRLSRPCPHRWRRGVMGRGEPEEGGRMGEREAGREGREGEEASVCRWQAL